MQLQLEKYRETHPHRIKRIIWRIVNSFIYPLFNKRERVLILRLFGARIGRECFIYRNVKIHAPWNLSLGDAVCIGPRVEIYNRGPVSIGSQIVISQDAYLCTASHDISSPLMKPVVGVIEIGNQCWIAAKATILPDVKIGEGAVVGACSVVVKDVRPWDVVGGNPAQRLKKRVLSEDSIIY